MRPSLAVFSMMPSERSAIVLNSRLLDVVSSRLMRCRLSTRLGIPHLTTPIGSYCFLLTVMTNSFQEALEGLACIRFFLEEVDLSIPGELTHREQ